MVNQTNLDWIQSIFESDTKNIDENSLELLFQLVSELIDENPNLREELLDLNVTVNLTQQDYDKKIYASIKDGKFIYGVGAADNPNVSVKADSSFIFRFLMGMLDGAGAITPDQYSIDGNFADGAIFVSVFSSAVDIIEELIDNL